MSTCFEGVIVYGSTEKGQYEKAERKGHGNLSAWSEHKMKWMEMFFVWHQMPNNYLSKVKPFYSFECQHISVTAPYFIAFNNDHPVRRIIRPIHPTRRHKVSSQKLNLHGKQQRAHNIPWPAVFWLGLSCSAGSAALTAVRRSSWKRQFIINLVLSSHELWIASLAWIVWRKSASNPIEPVSFLIYGPVTEPRNSARYRAGHQLSGETANKKNWGWGNWRKKGTGAGRSSERGVLSRPLFLW